MLWYGDGEGLYRTHLFGVPSIIVFSPAANRFVFKSEAFILEWPNVDIMGKYSISAVHGPAHTRLRSFLSRNLNHPDALRRIALLVQPRIITAIQSWADQGTIVAYKEVKKVTFENIGKYFASIEPGLVLDKLDKYLVGLLDGVRAYPVNIPGTDYHHALQCRGKAVALFREEIEKRRVMDNTKPIVDLLDGLMQMKDDEGSMLSDMEVLDNVVSVLVASYESTVISTIWAIYFLAKHSKVLQKLREEHMSLKENKGEDFVSSDEIFKLKYTNKVVEESLRMANVAAVMFRTATEDVEYKGYMIPKGWKVALWIRYIHTDPENFDDPLCFNPDRWDEPMKPGTYQVFGGGSRTCPANNLARLQVALVLYHLVTRYEWELVNPNAGVSYLPHPKPEDGVEITIKKLYN